MRIHGLCVCVDYSHFLSVSGRVWREGLESLTVVTTPGDFRTKATVQALQSRAHIPIYLHETSIFYERGASFNKGAAMEEARLWMPWEDWILFFDVDIVPERKWAEVIPPSTSMGYLYSAPRYQAARALDIGDTTVPLVPDDRIGYGYFQLFHSRDPKVQRVPVLDTHWKHAGNADSNFLLSFGQYVRELPIDLWHIGPAHENWFGVGKEAEFRNMQKVRGGQGIHPSERIDNSLP